MDSTTLIIIILLILFLGVEVDSGTGGEAVRLPDSGWCHPRQSHPPGHESRGSVESLEA